MPEEQQTLSDEARAHPDIVRKVAESEHLREIDGIRTRFPSLQGFEFIH